MNPLSSSQFLSNCSILDLARAAAALKAGALVAFPTETVYGLGADATNEVAVRRIYEVKGRPIDHPLIIHIESLEGLGIWAKDIPTYAINLARDFWPGPMTLVLTRNTVAQDFITGGQESVGLRVPAHALALGLLKEFGKIGGLGIAAPSANRFGQVSPTTALAVEDEIGGYLSKEDLLLDGGSALVGVESTIIDCTGNVPRILRPGAVTQNMIEDSSGLLVGFQEISGGKEIRVSGSLEVHYSPKAKVILGAIAEPGEGFIALASIATPKGAIRLAAPRNTEEFARILYAALRDADTKGISKIAVIAPEGEGLALAIRDRLQRSASGK